jgi:hypothetical protein
MRVLTEKIFYVSLTFVFLIIPFAHKALAAEVLDVSPLRGKGDLSEAFFKYYEPVAQDYKINMPQYSLPLALNKISNLKKFEEFSFVIQAGKNFRKISLVSPASKEKLRKNGFVVVDGGREDKIADVYKKIRKWKVPLYITADTPLHLFHIMFNETLKEIEEEIFYPDIIQITKVLLRTSEEDYKKFDGILKEAAKRNVAYFSIALKQFETDFSPPSYVKNQVDWECGRIDEHKGFPAFEVAHKKALFKVPEDYSQYKPRGHYTRSDELKRYFRGMMWYGRMTFLAKGSKSHGQMAPFVKTLISENNSNIQTIQAVLISAHCGELTVSDGRKVSDIWDRIYTVSAFFAGFADDLTLYDYREVLRGVFGSKFSADELKEKEKFSQFVSEIRKLTPPEIYSGTGNAGVDLGAYGENEPVPEKQRDDLMENTMGFRFMGQRYIPDSYILGQLVFPVVGELHREIPERFTAFYIMDLRNPGKKYSIRAFPRGLDVFSVFGSKRAEKHIIDSKDHEYPKYEEQVQKLREEFSKLSEEDWNRNLYWSWLHLLKILNKERGGGYQTYQQTEAYLDRQLNTSLASWAALRHNTILYAKQSYSELAAGAGRGGTKPPPPEGFVEPLPEFFTYMLATVEMAYRGLEDLEVLTEKSEKRLSSLIDILNRLNDICKSQVANKRLSDDDNRFLHNFPGKLEKIIGKVKPTNKLPEKRKFFEILQVSGTKGLETTIIADVHTDPNSKKCLEEGSGYLDYLLVAYKRSYGDIVLAVGPVVSYYEFKHPVSNRLTDEEWREMLKKDDAPSQPEWINTYYVE